MREENIQNLFLLKNLSLALDELILFGRKVDLDRKALSHLSINSFYEYQKGMINSLDARKILNDLALKNSFQRKIEDHIELLY